MAQHQKIMQDWIVSLMKNMEDQFQPDSRMRLMESCGRDCARRSSIYPTQTEKIDPIAFANTLKRYIGKENVIVEDGVIRLQYDTCFCPLVGKGPDRLPESYCHCSVGWLKEMFEKASGESVSVELIQSIKRGAPSCQFIVRW